MVQEFYENVANIKKGTKVTKVRNLKVRFDQHTLNTYLGYEDVELKEYLEKYALGDAARPWLADTLAVPGPPPPWIADEVPIHCIRLDPSQNKTNLPIPRAVPVTSIMAGYPINMGVMMSANISVIARQGDSSYPYPNTITEYLIDAMVKPRCYDTKVRPKKPFTWYSLMDANNPKKKVQPPTTASQSDEPATVDAEAVDVPSTSAEPSSSVAAMPMPSSTTLTIVPTTAPTSALKSVPMPTTPLYALRVSQTLESLNNWM
nr:uncharacterized protein LOC108948496 isoform X1 [Nicotiana tomentosiformis]